MAPTVSHLRSARPTLTAPATPDGPGRNGAAEARASQQPSPLPAPLPPPDVPDDLAPRLPAGAGQPLDPAALTARPPLQVIVIDPGHGGDDIGARGPGVEEKQLTIEVARRLRALLEKSGFKVVTTRDADMAVDLSARAAVANSARGDLFLSLHANTAPTPTPAGAEVYHLQIDATVEAARQRASKSSVPIPTVAGGTRPLRLVPWELAQAGHVDRSAELAATLVEQFRAARLPVSPTPVRKAPLRVVAALDMPAVLVEIAYLSNPTQAKLAASNDFRDSVAKVLHDGIMRYRRRLEEPRGK